jgi:hypothetical protein
VVDRRRRPRCRAGVESPRCRRPADAVALAGWLAAINVTGPAEVAAVLQLGGAVRGGSGRPRFRHPHRAQSARTGRRASGSADRRRDRCTVPRHVVARPRDHALGAGPQLCGSAGRCGCGSTDPWADTLVPGACGRAGARASWWRARRMPSADESGPSAVPGVPRRRSGECREPGAVVQPGKRGGEEHRRVRLSGSPGRAGNRA